MDLNDRADLIQNKSGTLTLSNVQARQLDEVLYTLREAGRLERMQVEGAVQIYLIVQMILHGKYTDDMRL